MGVAIAMRGLKNFGKRKASAPRVQTAHVDDRGISRTVVPSESAASASASHSQAAASACDARREDGARVAAMPLAFVSAGGTAVVAAVRGNAEACHHLENLGFVEGARVGVVCETAGNLIVEVKGAQVALDRSIAMKVSVRA